MWSQSSLCKHMFSCELRSFSRGSTRIFKSVDGTAANCDEILTDAWYHFQGEDFLISFRSFKSNPFGAVIDWNQGIMFGLASQNVSWLTMQFLDTKESDVDGMELIKASSSNIHPWIFLQNCKNIGALEISRLFSWIQCYVMKKKTRLKIRPKMR